MTPTLDPQTHPYLVTVPGRADRRFSNFALALESCKGASKWEIVNSVNNERWSSEIQILGAKPEVERCA